MMTLIRHWRLPLRFVMLFMTAVLGSSLFVAVAARPAAAAIPTDPCYSGTEGLISYEFFGDGTNDYVAWECTKTVSTPIIYYWRLHKIGNLDDDLEAMKESVVRFGEDELWSGIVTSGFGVLRSGAHRAHVRYVGAFDLKNWSGNPIKRDMGVYMVVKHSLDGGGTWGTCAQTGWKDASSAASVYSYEFYKLTSDCGGQVELFTKAHFYKLTTSSWWTSPWVKAGPYTILSY